MRAFRSWLTGCAAVLPLLSAGATAQQAPKAKETVEVSGRRPAVLNLMDRQSYSIERDLQSATGSLSDILKNLPSVEIDVLGAISLRGDPNVTILIDGKRSALLAGNTAEALEQIPTDTIDRIEVITNPSAEFRAEGSGGIINIITRKNAEPGYSGTLRLNAGNDGRINASASGAAKLGRYSLNGSLSERRDVRYHAGSIARTLESGGAAGQVFSDKFTMAARIATLGGTVELDPRNELEAKLVYSSRGGHYNSRERNTSELAGVFTGNDRLGIGKRGMKGLQAKLEYVHAFAAKGEEFKLELTRGTHWENGLVDYTTADGLTGIVDEYETQNDRATEASTEIDAAYVLPLSGGAKLKMGYALEDENNKHSTSGFYRGAGSSNWLADPDFTGRFQLGRAVHAGYATYENKFGDFGVLAGLRLEQEYLSTNQLLLGEAHKSATLGVYPSLHLTYNFADTKLLKFSYSRRVNRPDDDDLDPSSESHDAFNIHAGNPLLLPEETDSVELAYQYAGEKLDALISGYFRSTSKGITEVSRYISDTVLFTTKENLASSIATGLEANLNGDIIKNLGFSLNGNASYNEIDPGPLSAYGTRSGITWSAKASLNWQITPDDLLQFSTNYSAKRFLPQGYREPTFTANAEFRHNFEGGLSAVFTVANLFDSNTHNTVLDAPGVHEVNKRSHPGRVMFAGLVYSFGGSAEKDSGITIEE